MPKFLGLAGSTGEVLVQYEKQLSNGAMGSIWLGRLASGAETGRLVIVRRILLELLDVADVERIQLAAGASARLKSPSLVKLLGVTQINGDLGCVSEYLAGVRLSDLQHCLIETESSMPAGVAVRLVLEVAKAGVVAHRLLANLGILASQRVVIREGVLVALFGEALLTDVGVLAGLLRCRSISSIPAVIAGLAPEEILNPEVTCGSPEVFTLGVVLWELLTNRWLFPRHLDSGATRNAVTHQPIAPITSVERLGLPVPEPLARVLGQAMQRDPRKRYGSLEAFIDALEQLPSHCVASIEQLGNCIRAFAPQILPDCDNSAIWPLDPERGRGFSRSSPPITLGPANTHDWDPPTFAERQLVTPAFDITGREQTVSEPIAPVFALSLPVSHYAPRKLALPIIVGSALFLAALASTLVLLHQRRSDEIVQATAEPAQSFTTKTSTSPNHILPGAARFNPTETLESTTRAAAASAAPPKQDIPKVLVAPAAAESSPKLPAGSNRSDVTSNGSYRPHKILPFRPKGI
jgi:serine/threonine protein kinase